MAIQWWGSARIRVVEMVAGGTEVEVVEVVDQQVVVGRKVSHKKWWNRKRKEKLEG
jgi:hypothetical protein